MLEFKDITIDDKELMSEYLDRDVAFMSERSFTSLFLWADHYRIKMCFKDDVLYLCSDFYPDYFLFFPPFTGGDYKEALQNILEYAKTMKETVKFNCVSQAQKEHMEATFPGQFLWEENRSSFDYIYSGEDLMWLSGKKFSAKRNHVNKFLAEYEDMWVYEDMDPATQYDEVVAFQLAWCRSRGEDDCENSAETMAIKKALTNFNPLGLTGGVLRVNGKMVAFTIGKRVYPNLFGVMFEKADIQYNGAYPMINQQFAQHNFQGVEFVNREEDLGIEGLRKAKLSYNPIELTTKYIAVPISLDLK